MSKRKPDLTKAGTPRKRAPGGGRKTDVPGENATVRLVVMIQPSRDDAYTRAAGKQKLPDWVKATLDAASGYRAE